MIKKPNKCEECGTIVSVSKFKTKWICFACKLELELAIRLHSDLTPIDSINKHMDNVIHPRPTFFYRENSQGKLEWVNYNEYRYEKYKYGISTRDEKVERSRAKLCDFCKKRLKDNQNESYINVGQKAPINFFCSKSCHIAFTLVKLNPSCESLLLAKIKKGEEVW